MLKLALCLCFLAQLVHGQIDGYREVEIFTCDDPAQDNIPQLIIRTEESGNVSSPCYDGNRTDYTKELDAGLRIANITHDRAELYGYELTIKDFQIADSDRLYIGKSIVDAGRNSQGTRDFILTSNATDGKIYVQTVEDGPITQVLNLGSNNKLLLNVDEGFNSVFLDFYTVVDTLGGRGFLITYVADINRCEFTGADVWCKNDGNCTRTGVNTASCDCTAFWTGDRCDDDVDECADETDNCHRPTNATCINKDGGFDCECKSGYSGTGENCTDIDECDPAIDTHECAKTGNCSNKDGGYDCICNAGYENGTDGPCSNIDECLNGHDCDDSSRAECTDGIGSFTCKCLNGYSGDGRDCANIDECADMTDMCDDEGGICTDTNGTYVCSCETGFTQDDNNCDDIDECDKDDPTTSNNCDGNATCTNSIGNYSCACNMGFSGDGFDCEDDDECTPGPPGIENNCAPANSTCENIPGSFKCTCDDGYTGDGTECKNVDECADSTSCHEDADCKDNDGSFECTCKDGFSGDGQNCEDINECDGGHNCHPNATCTNDEPFFTCTCNDGYTGNGRTCEDIDECTPPATNECKANSKCQNEEGNYTCPCNPGFSGDGFIECVDINECQPPNVNNCTAPVSICDNNVGSFRCICNRPVYRGDDNTDCDYYCDHDTDCRTDYATGFLEMPRVWDGSTRYDFFKETFWNFTGKAGSNGLRLRFLKFDTEIKDDFLSIYPGNVLDIDKEIVAISGKIGNLYNEEDRVTTTGNIENTGSTVTAHLDISTNEPVLTLSSSDLLFVFTSDRRNISTGFRLTWEYDTNDCPPENPCFNGGTCDDRAFTYQCVGCTGYTGMNCDIDINECTDPMYPHDCDDNAACDNNNGSFTCTCNADYTGNGKTCYQFIVLDNLNVIKTVSSLEVSFDVSERWSSPEYISMFTLSLSSLPDGTFEREFDFNSTDLVGKSFTFTGLRSYTEYNLTIVIKETGSLFGDSVLQNDVITQIITTTELAAGVPRNFRLSDTQRDRITLSWDKPMELGSGSTDGFGKVLHYQVCFSPSAAGEKIADTRGISMDDECLILDDTYTTITLTTIYSYVDLAFKIRAYSSKGYGDFTTVETSFPGTLCPEWDGGTREDCDGTDELLLQSNGFPREITSSDNEVIEQYWSFDHSLVSAWRINIFYFDLQLGESSLDYGYGELDIADHDTRKDNIVETFTGVLSGIEGPYTKNTSNPFEDSLWLAFISDRTRKRPGFQVEIEPDGNSCDSNPCLHGGICTDGTFSYTCDCTSTDWTGPNCENPHIKPTATCTTGKRNVDVDFQVQDEWKNDETVIGGYTISISNPDGDSESKMIGDTTAGFTGLVPFTTYSVTVTVVQPEAVSLRDNAVWNTASISCQTKEDVPSQPQNVVVTPKSLGFDVTWDAPAQPNGVVTYTVTYKSVDHGTYGETATEVESAAQDTTTYSITGLIHYRMYDIIVKAMTSAGARDADTVTKTTLPGAPAPFVDEPATVTVIPNKAARVEWAFVDSTYVGPVTVTVSAVTDIPGLAPVTNTSEPDGLRLIIGGLEEGQMYNFTLTASTGIGEDQVTNVNGVNTASIAPGVVASFTFDKDTSILTWTAPALIDQNGGLTGYTLTAVSAVPGFTTQTFDATVLSFDLTSLNLPPFTNYTFKLQAINDEGLGLETELTILTKDGVPATPSNLMEGEVNAENITISWEAEDPPVGNTIYIVSYSGGGTTASFETADTTAPISGLKPFTTYVITVEARTNAGISATAAELSVQTAEGKPGEVQTLKAEFVSDTYEIKVTWAAPDPLTGNLGEYTITWTQGDTTLSDTSPAVEYTIPNVVLSETEYSIEVYATTGGGDGPSVTVTTVTPKLIPEVPEDVTVTPGSTEVIVNIGAPGTLTPDNYTITLSQDTDDCIKFGDANCLSNDQTNQPTPSQIPFTITGLKSYRQYNLSVVAKGPGGESNASAVVPFQTLAGAPNPVTTISTSHQPGEVNVTFVPGRPLTGNTSYTVTLTGGPTSLTETVAATETVTDITVTFTDVDPNTEYTVKVVSTVDGQTASSPDDAAPPVTTNPETPTFTINAASATQLDITIDPAVAGATLYVATFEETGCGTNCTTGNATSTTTTISIQDLTPYTTYRIAVYAVSSAGQSAPSAIAENRTNAGIPTLINATYQIAVTTTEEATRGPYEIVLENVCNDKAAVFDESEGLILFITYIAIQDGTTEPYNETRTYGEVNDQDPSPPYEALRISCTTSKRRRKRKVTNDGKVVIGADNNCRDDDTNVCNGPLKPSTTYRFRACGENEARNRACTAESEPMTTDAAPASAGLTAGEIAAIVICSILLLILIILLIVYLVRRRNSRRGKHRVSRQGRENPTFDSTKSQQQQKYQVDPAAEPQTKYTSDPVA